MKKQPTVINGKWQMSWITDEVIAHRNMKLWERIRYLPKIIIQELII